jgi:phospholipid transport system transporter-binding protein
MTTATIARNPCADSISVEPISPTQICVSGALTFRTASRASLAGEEAITGTTAQTIEVDCRKVTGADSAGLAVLIDWVATARRAGRALHFSHLPAEILAVAEISEIEKLFA